MSSNFTPQSRSIDALRKAEKSAADKINEARKRKQRRLKQAKEEAKSEIDAFKEEMEIQFQNRELEETGNKDQYELYVKDMMDKELDKLNKSVQQNQHLALNILLDKLLNIETSLHQNFKLN